MGYALLEEVFISRSRRRYDLPSDILQILFTGTNMLISSCLSKRHHFFVEMLARYRGTCTITEARGHAWIISLHGRLNMVLAFTLGLIASTRIRQHMCMEIVRYASVPVRFGSSTCQGLVAVPVLSSW